MKLFLFSLFTLLFFGFSSCIEIIDDISINEDGSGTFKYTVNLSSSKVKINSILALDSLDGKKIPSINEITKKFDRIVNLLQTKEGISNVDFQSDYTNFLFKVKCDFTSLESLQTAIREIVLSENKGRKIKELNHSWLHFENKALTRSIPQITVAKASEINNRDIELLKKGHYTSITRFDKEISSFKNESGHLSKNKKAVMIRTNPYLLTQNPQLLDNTIYLKESE